MDEEWSWTGLRMAFKRGGSYQLTIHPEIVSIMWNKTDAESFPVCFLTKSDRVIIEDLDRLQSLDYPVSIKRRATRQYSITLAKKFMKEYKIIAKDLIDGDITYDLYLKKIDSLFSVQKKDSIEIGYKISRTVKEFFDVENSTGLLAFAETLERQDLEERFSYIYEEIEQILEYELNIVQVLSKLEECYKTKKIPKVENDLLKGLYERELSQVQKGLEKLKTVLSISK